MLGGVELIPDLSGALYAPEYETLIIADLHLEQGTSLARRGIHVPPFDTEVTLAHLEKAALRHVEHERLVALFGKRLLAHGRRQDWAPRAPCLFIRAQPQHGEERHEPRGRRRGASRRE